MRSKADESVVQLGRVAPNAVRTLSSPEGRWTLVSSSLTASVAVTVTWLALAAQPAAVASTGGATASDGVMRFLAGHGKFAQASIVPTPSFITSSVENVV